ncbi:hypothetical protein ACMXYQ_11735 [Neptuniibacter sp. PT34_22]|uniref:hypothetical protein n=1 Tax=Neptuniibacter sp. PT34_22 TaxID=3398205 RepID=UPI0039F4F29E
MEKSSYSFIQLNTSTYLLEACDSVAIQIRRKSRLVEREGLYTDYVFDEPYSNIQSSTEFIGLNLTYINQLAAVLEGTLRTFICELMQRDSGIIGELSISKKDEKDYGALVRAYSVTKKYREDIEFKGGWDNLKRQYREVLNINLDSVLEKEKVAGINSIFTLRNVAAHGTAIVTPKIKLDDVSEGDYPFKWQSKLQNLSVYIKKEFNLDLLDALQHPSLCFHYTNLVKEFTIALRNETVLPINSNALFNNLKNYSFGYVNNYEFPTQDEK